MRPGSFATLLSVLSFLFASTATGATGQPSPNVIRVPLERKSSAANPLLHPHATRADSPAGYVNGDFFRSHAVDVAMKYRNTLAAYERNTGSPHPLAQAISAIGGFGTTPPVGRLEKRRRKRDATSDSRALGNPASASHVPRGHTKRGDISLTEVNSNMWMGSLSVGTPPQKFLVDFDTGSADMILPDQECGSSCDGHTRYNHTASSTAVDLGTTFQLSYAGGSNVNGTQYADNVCMGGYEAVNQTLGAATTYSTGLEIATFPPDGLLGMGFYPISALRASPVFQTMVSNGVVKQGVFGFALSSEPGKSELTIGGTNTDIYQKSTTEYFNVTLQAYWQVRLIGLSRPGLDNTPDVVVVNRTSYAQSIIDTGTTLIITSDSNAEAFYANVTGANDIGNGIWIVPCNVVGSLAPTLTFGSHNFSISPSTFNLGPVSPGSTDCIAGLAGGGSSYWIIGDVFLQNVYAIFDVTNSRVGFADLV